MTRRLETLGEHDVRSFRSGVKPLDDFLRGPARKNTARGIGRTFLLLRGDDDPQEWPDILGFFTLSMAQLPSEVAQQLSGERLPGYPIPVALIGRLANDVRVRGAGVGTALLGEAIHLIVQASERIACFGVVVDAKDDAALRFYMKFAFTPIGDERAFPRRCFLHIQTAKRAIESP